MPKPTAEEAEQDAAHILAMTRWVFPKTKVEAPVDVPFRLFGQILRLPREGVTFIGQLLSAMPDSERRLEIGKARTILAAAYPQGLATDEMIEVRELAAVTTLAAVGMRVYDQTDGIWLEINGGEGTKAN